MEFSKLYAGAQNPGASVQAVSPASAAVDSVPVPVTAGTLSSVSVSWLGLVIAVILLRIVYEVSE
jgi:hypothetical protein